MYYFEGGLNGAAQLLQFGKSLVLSKINSGALT
jgi:hypothetical protein